MTRVLCCWLALTGLASAGVSTFESRIDQSLVCQAWNTGKIQRRGFVCINILTGTALGAGLDRRGRVVCVIEGVFDGCLTIVGCGMDQTACGASRVRP